MTLEASQRNGRARSRPKCVRIGFRFSGFGLVGQLRSLPEVLVIAVEFISSRCADCKPFYMCRIRIWRDSATLFRCSGNLFFEWLYLPSGAWRQVDAGRRRRRWRRWLPLPRRRPAGPVRVGSGRPGRSSRRSGPSDVRSLSKLRSLNKDLNIKSRTPRIFQYCNGVEPFSQIVKHLFNDVDILFQ